MKSTQPDAIALAGMPSYLAELGSWAKVMPASPLIAARPRLHSLPQMQQPVRDRHIIVRRDDVDMIGRDLRALYHLQHRHPGSPAKYLGYCALPGRVEMEYHDESHAQDWR